MSAIGRRVRSAPLCAEISHGIFTLSVHLFSTTSPDAVHWHANRCALRQMAHRRGRTRGSQSKQKSEKEKYHERLQTVAAQNDPDRFRWALLTAMLLVSTPSCKAQEVSPDHFTDTGVQDVYDAAPATVAAPAMKQTLAASQASARHMNTAANTQSASKLNVVLSAKLDTPAVADRRKSVAAALPKQ